MSERELLPEIDEEQAKAIDRNLALGFAFLRDVLHRPEIVDAIPSGSTLVYRAIPLPPFELTVRLTAFRPRRTRRWSVRVTGIGEFGAPPFDRPAVRWLYSILPLVEHATWASADEAFAAFERALRTPTTPNSWLGSSAAR
jgi:hypothetical protein